MDFSSSLLQEALLKIQNNRDQHPHVNSILKNLLHSNNLAIRLIPEGGSNLMKALSDCLYFTTTKHSEIQSLCLRYFQKLFQSKKLSRNLQKFHNNFSLLSHYFTDPALSIFDDVNLELVSMIYKVKVVVFSVGDDSYLNQKQINSKNNTKSIQLLWDDGVYTPVYDETFLEHAKISQNIVYELLGGVLQAELINPDHEFVNLEYQHWLEKENQKESSLSPYKFSSLNEGVTLKRSLSQQDLKETYPLDEHDIRKCIQAPVGYHNLKTANERIQTQGKPSKKFTFDLNECEDDTEDTTAAEDLKMKFISEFLDPISNHLHLHQSEETQECAPISPVEYKQFMPMNSQKQQQQQQQKQQFRFSPFNTQKPLSLSSFKQPDQFPTAPQQIQQISYGMNQPSSSYFGSSNGSHFLPLFEDPENQVPLPIESIKAKYEKVSEAWNSQEATPIQILPSTLAPPLGINQQVGGQLISNQRMINQVGQNLVSSINTAQQQMNIFQQFPLGYANQLLPQTNLNFDQQQSNQYINQVVVGQPIQPCQVMDGLYLQNQLNTQGMNPSQQYLGNISLLHQNINLDNNSIDRMTSGQTLSLNSMKKINQISAGPSLAFMNEQNMLQNIQGGQQINSLAQIMDNEGHISGHRNDMQQMNQQLFNSLQNLEYRQNYPKQILEMPELNNQQSSISSYSDTFSKQEISPFNQQESNQRFENDQKDMYYDVNYINPPTNIRENSQPSLIKQTSELRQEKLKDKKGKMIPNPNQQKQDEQGKVKELKKPEVLEQTEEKKKGRLKFFDTSNNFGFFNLDEDQSDVFVHFDDLQVTSVPKETLKHSSLMNLRFKFHFIKYIGRHKKSRKAVDIEYLPEESDETIQQSSDGASTPSLSQMEQQNSNNTFQTQTDQSNIHSSQSLLSLSPEKSVSKSYQKKINMKSRQDDFQTQGYETNNNQNIPAYQQQRITQNQQFLAQQQQAQGQRNDNMGQHPQKSTYQQMPQRNHQQQQQQYNLNKNNEFQEGNSNQNNKNSNNNNNNNNQGFNKFNNFNNNNNHNNYNNNNNNRNKGIQQSNKSSSNPYQTYNYINNNNQSNFNNQNNHSQQQYQSQRDSYQNNRNSYQNKQDPYGRDINDQQFSGFLPPNNGSYNQFQMGPYMPFLSQPNDQANNVQNFNYKNHQNYKVNQQGGYGNPSFNQNSLGMGDTDGYYNQFQRQNFQNQGNQVYEQINQQHNQQNLNQLNFKQIQQQQQQLNYIEQNNYDC